MNTIIKCSLVIGLGLGLAACNDDDKYDGKAAGGGDMAISANQLLTSVFMQDANAEPISVNDKTITDSSDPIDVDSL